jgi:hypothetical protein
MESSISRMQLRLVVASYAVVGVFSALLIFERYLLYIRNPQDVAAAGGMYAGGDLMLEVIIGFFFLVPTAALAFVIRRSEAAYTTYAKVMLGLSLTAPASVGFLIIPILNQWYWGDACIFRLFAIPLMLIVLTFSWWLTRFARARRLISYALLIEGLTLVGVLLAAVFFLSKGSGRPN